MSKLTLRRGRPSNSREMLLDTKLQIVAWALHSKLIAPSSARPGTFKKLCHSPYCECSFLGDSLKKRRVDTIISWAMTSAFEGWEEFSKDEDMRKIFGDYPLKQCKRIPQQWIKVHGIPARQGTKRKILDGPVPLRKRGRRSFKDRHPQGIIVCEERAVQYHKKARSMDPPVTPDPETLDGIPDDHLARSAQALGTVAPYDPYKRLLAERLREISISNAALQMFQIAVEKLMKYTILSMSVLARHSGRQMLKPSDIVGLRLVTCDRFDDSQRHLSKLSDVIASLVSQAEQEHVVCISHVEEMLSKLSLKSTKPAKALLAQHWRSTIVKMANWCLVSAKKADRTKVEAVDIVSALQHEAFDYAGYSKLSR